MHAAFEQRREGAHPSRPKLARSRVSSQSSISSARHPTARSPSCTGFGNVPGVHLTIDGGLAQLGLPLDFRAAKDLYVGHCDLQRPS